MPVSDEAKLTTPDIQIFNQSEMCGILEELVGEDYDFIISELPRRIRDAFSRDSRILSADNFVFSDGSGGKLVCSFDVHTVFGTISEEVGM